jgi:hypothetical protein
MTGLLAAAALPIFLGLLGSRFASALAGPGDGALYRLALYVLSGAVVLHLVLTLLDFVGLPWNPILLGVLGALILATVWRFMPRSPERARLPSDLGWGDGLAVFALIAFTLVALTGWIAIPDFVYHWGLKGHRYYLVQGVDYTYLARSWNWVVHSDYPNLAPELFATTALLAGGFDVPAMMLGTGIFFALLLAAAREGLRQGGADRFTLQAGLALVALSAGAFGIGHLMAGSADWMMALALAAAVPPLLRPPDRIGDFQIGVIAAFAAASKVEGVPLAAILILTQLARRVWVERRLSPSAMARTGLPAVAVALPWFGRAAYHHLFLPLNSGPLRISRGGEILSSIWEALGTSAWHGFAFAALLPPLLLFHRRTRSFAAVAALQFVFYLYVYFTVQVGEGALRMFVLSNFARLVLHLVPATLVVALVAWGGRPGSVPLSPSGREGPRE